MVCCSSTKNPGSCLAHQAFDHAGRNCNSGQRWFTSWAKPAAISPMVGHARGMSKLVALGLHRGTGFFQRRSLAQIPS